MFGTLQIEVLATSLRFLTSSDIRFTNQSQPQAPLVDGSTGTSTAAFGLNVQLPPLVTGVVAGRDYVADAVSDPIDRVGATFDARQVLFNITSGVTSYNVTMLGDPVSGSTEIYNDAPNEDLSGILVLDQGTYMMLMPITIHGETSIDDVSIAIAYQGLLVATHVIEVPEPSSLVLVALGAVAAAVVGSKRRKR